MNDVLDLTQRFAAAEAIDALADALEHNPAFVENTRARRLAFDAMVRIGESDQSGRLIYRRLAQARVILRALDDHDPAALGAVVRRSCLLDPKYHAEAVDALTRLLLVTDQVNTIQEAAFSLAQIGEASHPALPALKRLLEEPEKANPECWREITVLTPETFETVPKGWRDEFIATWDERSVTAQVDLLTSVAIARVRIAPEILASDIDIYPRSPLLTRVGARVLWSSTLSDRAHPRATLFDADEETQRKAAHLVSEFAHRTDNPQERTWAILTIELVLRSSIVSEESKAHWRVETVRAAEAAGSEEVRRAMLDALLVNSPQK